MSEFEADLLRARSELDAARAGLLAVVEGLGKADLNRSRRGGWPLRTILHHVIDGEAHYSRGIETLRGKGGLVSAATRADVQRPQDAIRLLRETREGLLASIEGIDEETFYTLKTLRTQEQEYGQQYSVLSVLENVALHDREHTAQIEAVLAMSQTAEP